MGKDLVLLAELKDWEEQAYVFHPPVSRLGDGLTLREKRFFVMFHDALNENRYGRCIWPGCTCKEILEPDRDIGGPYCREHYLQREAEIMDETFFGFEPSELRPEMGRGVDPVNYKIE